MDSAVTGQLQNVVGDLTNSFKNLANQIQQLSTSLQRLATAGLQATSEGNRLSFVWLMFTRQIAGIVLPVVNFLIDKINILTQWFKNLSGDAQFLILKLGLMAAAITVLVPVVSALIYSISPLTAVMAILVPALTYFFTESEMGKAILEKLTAAIQWLFSSWEDLLILFDTAVGGLVKAFQVVAAGFMWLGLKIVGIIEEILDWIPGLDGATQAIREFREYGEKQYQMLIDDIASPIKVREKGKREGRQRTDVNPSGFGFESLSASFERITSAANKTDLQREMADTAKKQLEQQKLIASGIEGVKQAVAGVGGMGGGDF